MCLRVHTVYVYVFVCVRVCVCARMCVCVCLRARVCACANAYMSACVRACVRTCPRARALIYRTDIATATKRKLKTPGWFYKRLFCFLCFLSNEYNLI